MIRVTIPLSEYSASVAKKGSLYYMYLNPEFLEDDTVSAFEVSFGSTEPTQEEIDAAKASCLRQLKGLLLMRLNAQDKSSAVNTFTFNGITMWRNRDERACLMNAVLSAEALGDEKVVLGLGDSYEFNTNKAHMMLAHLEKYALTVNNNTIAHRNAINALESCDDAFAYDCTTGYPTPLAFDIEGNLITE